MAKTKKSAPERPMPPRKPKYAEDGAIKYLTEDEVDSLRRAAGRLGRHRLRDSTMILIGYRHGLRVSELVNLRWEQVNFKARTVYVRRLKRGKHGMHNLSRVEVDALRKLQKASNGPFVFENERGGELTRNAFFKLLSRAGQACNPPIKCNPHMLRHGLGFYMINAGYSTRRTQEELGHRSVATTEKYTQLAPDRSEPLWDD